MEASSFRGEPFPNWDVDIYINGEIKDLDLKIW
jgi:hypothetical protein